MRKDVIRKLEKMAEIEARRWSNPENKCYTESYEVFRIRPITGDFAVVIFQKTRSKLLAMAVAFYNPKWPKDDGWRFIVPTDGHLLGMQSNLLRFKDHLENQNYEINDGKYKKEGDG